MDRRFPRFWTIKRLAPSRVERLFENKNYLAGSKPKWLELNCSWKSSILTVEDAGRLCREISTLSSAGDDHNGLLPPVPYEGSERTVAWYIQSIRPHDERTYRRVETLPGEQAQADWGHFGYINTDGKHKHLYAFSSVLRLDRVFDEKAITKQ